MVTETTFSLAHATPEEIIAIVGFVAFHLGFFIWLLYLVRSR
jgi:hypothetical protein